MPSIRKRLAENINDSKNTRMDILGAGIRANWRPDELAHMSRFDKIACLIMGEAKSLGRPLNLLEVGCGQLWTLRLLESAYVVTKKDQVASYLGYDIDPACLVELDGWPNALGELFKSTWIQKYNAIIKLQDLTTNSVFATENESIDFFYTTEVIEHMKPEFIEPWIKDAHRCLRPGGLIYISTPNSDGSNKVLPKDHVYEWGFQELRSLLERYFKLEAVTGTFIQMHKFNRIQSELHRIPDELLKVYEDRFGHHWLRVMLAATYPEVSNNCNWRLRKI